MNGIVINSYKHVVPWETVGGNWITTYGSAMTIQANGVADPSGPNQSIAYNQVLSGDFVLSFNWSALGTSVAGMAIGVAPWGPPGISASYSIYHNYESSIPTNDWVCIFERPDGNDYHLMQNGYVLNPHFRIGDRTTETMQIRRVSNVFYITEEDGTVLHTFSGTSTGADLAVGVAVSTDSNNATIENIQWRPL